MCISRNTGITRITNGITHKNTSNTVLLRNTGSLAYYGYFFQGGFFD